MNRFSKFTNGELEVLEDALCQYGTKSKMIDEIRNQMRDRKPVSYEKNHCANYSTLKDILIYAKS